MRPAEDQTSEFVADALECLKIKFGAFFVFLIDFCHVFIFFHIPISVNNVEDVNNKDPKYPIEFAYVKFGDL